MNPYGPLIRYGAYVAIAGLVAMWIVTSHFRLEAATARAEMATTERDAAKAELDHLVHSTAIAEELVAADLLTLRELAPKYAALEKRIRDYAKKPVIPACAYVLDPWITGADGMRELEDRGAALPGSAGRAADPFRRTSHPDGAGAARAER